MRDGVVAPPLPPLEPPDDFPLDDDDDEPDFPPDDDDDEPLFDPLEPPDFPPDDVDLGAGRTPAFGSGLVHCGVAVSPSAVLVHDQIQPATFLKPLTGFAGAGAGDGEEAMRLTAAAPAAPEAGTVVGGR